MPKNDENYVVPNFVRCVACIIMPNSAVEPLLLFEDSYPIKIIVVIPDLHKNLNKTTKESAYLCSAHYQRLVTNKREEKRNEH